ncbi:MULTISPECIES: response regulator transcription factor [Pseudovibrio]|uniref:response regulator transcription factor n=1 Tax=Stappiaceae TaxID=2821832 RepID=UPI002366E6F8|nr:MULTISPECIES: LuxR C-terminal-related transcriptional regulator [Pseudovibrio]MDD7910286.1 LuxR C-terminal-related transcriptional regulator [Pseudovibrio exalbescens]MDX5594001.1 LuxR C-terminal-related transcriptional regulator [Pseudovibrio sp. SPO723]
MLFDTMDRLNRGVVLLEADATITAVNATATNLLTNANYFRLFLGKVELVEQAAQKQLLAALAKATEQEGSNEASEFVIRRETEFLRPLHIEVVGARQRDESAGRILMFITDLEADWSVKILRAARIFYLTEREASVLEHLSGTETEQQIAETLSITHNTLRTHRKNIYAKLNVNSRLELAILLSRLT